MNPIELRDLKRDFGATQALKGVSLEVKERELFALLGPDGAGKSTLIKTMAGLIKPSSGYITVNGCDIRRYSSRKRARAISYMPQKPDGLIPYTVYDYVMLGRYSMMGLMGVPSEEDREAAAEAIEICHIKHLENRIMSTLSGGELQRALLAGAVAQSAPVLLLDEPTTFLDPAHERLFFEALSRLSRKRELTIVRLPMISTVPFISVPILCT
jgi:iron complex transport system ATP-binding protein